MGQPDVKGGIRFGLSSRLQKKGREGTAEKRSCLSPGVYVNYQLSVRRAKNWPDVLLHQTKGPNRQDGQVPRVKAESRRNRKHGALPQESLAPPSGGCEI